MSSVASDRSDRLVRESLQRRWAGAFAPASQIDWLLLIATLLLTVVGFVMVYGATAARPDVAEGNYFVERQVLAFFLGLVAAAGVTLVDYRRFRAWSIVFYGISVVLLVAVLVAGVEVNGARAWFRFGPMQFQPAEVAKIALILVLAAHFHEYREEGRGLRALVEALGFALLPMLLLLMQPDFGLFMVFAVVVAFVLLMAGVHIRYIAGLVAASVAGIGAALQLGIVKEYQLDRLTAFLNPEGDIRGVSYNVDQAQIAVGSGQLFGQGIGSGSQTTSGFVPENQTDFIFTVIGEQTGFIGSIIVIGLFALLIWRGLHVAAVSRDMFGTLIAVGVTSVFLFQMLISIGMAMGIMPVSGLPLPFISYGGSSMITSWVMVGLLQSVHMRRYSA